MAVITKKEEKAETIIRMMTNKEGVEEFKKLFKENYPDDYSKMFKVFNIEERKEKKVKDTPCRILTHI